MHLKKLVGFVGQIPEVTKGRLESFGRLLESVDKVNFVLGGIGQGCFLFAQDGW